MREYEQKFANPLLAMAFKDGVDFVGDPDIRARNPRKDPNGSSLWIVDIEDDSDDDDVEENVKRTSHTATEVLAKPEVKKPSRISFEEFKDITKGNMVPKTPKREAGTIIENIAEPKSSPRPRGRVIIPVDDNDDNSMYCGQCISCKTGLDCIHMINEATSIMMGRER